MQLLYCMLFYAVVCYNYAVFAVVYADYLELNYAF